MQLSNLLFLAVASSVSATETAQETAANTQASGVTVYEHIHYRGHSYEIPSVNRCWRLPQTLVREASSIQIRSPGVSCALFRNPACFPPALFAGLRQSVPDLHDIGLGDEIVTVYCALIGGDDE